MFTAHYVGIATGFIKLNVIATLSGVFLMALRENEMYTWLVNEYVVEISDFQHYLE